MVGKLLTTKTFPYCPPSIWPWSLFPPTTNAQLLIVVGILGYLEWAPNGPKKWLENWMKHQRGAHARDYDGAHVGVHHKGMHGTRAAHFSCISLMVTRALQRVSLCTIRPICATFVIPCEKWYDSGIKGHSHKQWSYFLGKPTFDRELSFWLLKLL